jgi:DNA gyrase subunit A
MITLQGVIKKTPLQDFANIRRTGIIAINLGKGDSLQGVRLSVGKDQIIMTTRQGQSIRFAESQIRPMGRAAAGVRAIKLKKNDVVAGFDIIREEDKEKQKGMRLLVIMEHGFAKQSSLKEYKVQRRGGSGIKAANVTAKTGPIIAAHVLFDEEELLALSAKGQIIRTAIASIRIIGRSAQGVKIMDLKSGDRLAGIALL